MSRRTAKRGPQRSTATPEPPGDFLGPPAEAVDEQWDRFWVFVWAGLLVVVCFVAVYNAVDALP